MLRNVRHAFSSAPPNIFVQDGFLRYASHPQLNFFEIDASGLTLLPGLMDVHVHLRTPGDTHKEDWTTGTQAAAAGGVTMILDMPNNQPPVTTREILREKRELIQGTSYVNYCFYMGATFDAATGHSNIEEYLSSDALALKVYMGSSTGSLLVDREEPLEEIFRKAGEADRLVCVHAEDEKIMREHQKRFERELDPSPSIHSQIRDPEAARRAVEQALHWAEQYNTRLHICHVSTRAELELIARFKTERISCEVSPHHLFLTQDELDRQGNFAKMNPPLRTAEDNVALIEGIRSGLIDMVATDHAPHTLQEKQQNYWKAPAGVPGLETLLPLLLNAVHEGKLTLQDVVRVTSEGPARVFRLKDETGRLLGSVEEGTMANFVLVDLEKTQVVERGGFGARFTKCGWSVFEGRSLTGWPVLTVVNGEIVYRDEKICGIPQGKEVKRKR